MAEMADFGRAGSRHRSALGRMQSSSGQLLRMNADLEFLLSDLYRGTPAPDHLADLRKSGLADETIHLHRIRSVPPIMIARLLGFDIPSIRSAMLIPFPNPAGGFTDHVRVKVFPPLKDRRDHTVKYLQPRGSGVRLFFELTRLHQVLYTQVPLWLVEGEKKALAVAQLGLPAVGFCGIHGWHPAGSRELLADFNALRLDGRQVELVPDGDWRTNPHVARGALGLARALEVRGARVRIVLLSTRGGP